VPVVSRRGRTLLVLADTGRQTAKAPPRAGPSKIKPRSSG
jgi:hypothetical protein